ncbi:reverse transcriptase [Senna tora]|uniref:Reverse transcriptase n=1 Tax=Senna tora TaxID=362788 RepID=A0A834U2T7_9FABA|nr:reverse transcriptase [Senna tora]
MAKFLEPLLLCGAVYVGGSVGSFYDSHRLEFARDLRCSVVEVESDALSVFRLLQSHESCMSPLGTVIDSIFLLRSNFTSVQFKWVPRGANVVAHKLATVGSSLSDFRVWLEDYPNIISDVLASDGCVLVVASALKGILLCN